MFCTKHCTTIIQILFVWPSVCLRRYLDVSRSAAALVVNEVVVNDGSLLSVINHCLQLSTLAVSGHPQVFNLHVRISHSCSHVHSRWASESVSTVATRSLRSHLAPATHKIRRTILFVRQTSSIERSCTSTEICRPIAVTGSLWMSRSHEGETHHSAIYRMGSHVVTYHPMQVNVSYLNPSQTNQYSIYLRQRDGRLSCMCGCVSQVSDGVLWTLAAQGQLRTLIARRCNFTDTGKSLTEPLHISWTEWRQQNTLICCWRIIFFKLFKWWIFTGVRNPMKIFVF